MELAAKTGIFESDSFFTKLFLMLLPLLVDYLIFVTIVKAFNTLTAQEKKDVEEIREKYQKAMLTGVIDPSKDEYQNCLKRYKEIFQGKTNHYKVSSAYMISKCVFNDLIVVSFISLITLVKVPYVPEIYLKLIRYFFIGNTIFRTSSMMQRRLRYDINKRQNTLLSMVLPSVSFYFFGCIVYYSWFIGDGMTVLAVFFFIYFFLILFETLSEWERLHEIRKLVYLFLK